MNNPLESLVELLDGLYNGNETDFTASSLVAIAIVARPLLNMSPLPFLHSLSRLKCARDN
jgi:hypothetical protein